MNCATLDLSCSCPAWKFHPKTSQSLNRSCSHIDQFLQPGISTKYPALHLLVRAYALNKSCWTENHLECWRWVENSRRTHRTHIIPLYVKSLAFLFAEIFAMHNIQTLNRLDMDIIEMREERFFFYCETSVSFALSHRIGSDDVMLKSKNDFSFTWRMPSPTVASLSLVRIDPRFVEFVNSLRDYGGTISNSNIEIDPPSPRTNRPTRKARPSVDPPHLIVPTRPALSDDDE